MSVWLKIATALVIVAILFGIAYNVNTLITCDGTTVQGALTYECIES